MGHYRSNLRDLEFNLFEVFARHQILGAEPFADLDEDTARDILGEVERLATGELAESLLESDRNPPVWDKDAGTVTLPEAFKRSYHAWMDAEWWRMDIPERIGGTMAPRSLKWAAAELLLGANPAVAMYATGPNFAHVLERMGTPEQLKLAQLMIDRRWAATMVLTEPDAGSDVGAGRTKAVQQEDGSWHIEGVKRFITSGEHDLSENIIHFVLARPEGAGPGTKDLSLFIVPKYHHDDEGNLGERNGVYVANVEHKMGLKVSTTCELRFGEKHPAVGYLLGDVHDGIRQMFMVIEFARMLVGTKAIATLSTAYLNALDYAKERVQGADLTRATDKAAPRVTTTHHPDVRRMLMLQKAYAEGLRALVIYTSTFQDQVFIAEADGRTDDEAEKMNDLLLPLVKGFGSEKSYELLSVALQTYGGSGYLQDYPIEQYIRDAKIDTLYEGTTGIQGQDLFFRKIVKDQAQALMRLGNEIKEFVESDAGNGQLKEERAALGRGLEDVQAMVGQMFGWAMASQGEGKATELYKVGLNTTRLLTVMGDLVVGWLLLRQAEVALDALTGGGSERDQRFYQGKLATARFFATNRLPTIRAERKALESTTLELMDLDEASF
ncbi:MAG: acyl-CoA dehydrogenase [Streptosporangiales bacterium]|nr:acyl-CoA dehydrogenase [Streptosporangiales bacterium]